LISIEIFDMRVAIGMIEKAGISPC